MGFAVTRNTFLNNPLSGAASTETTSFDRDWETDDGS